MVRSVKDIEERVCYLERNLRWYLSERNLREHSNDIFDYVQDKFEKRGCSLKSPKFHVEILLNLEKCYTSLLTFCEDLVRQGEMPPREIKISLGD
jgi:hypothetical protein